jgi:predicted dehydrogenase
VLRGALVGCGSRGRLFLAAWRRVVTARIVAVADLDPARAAAAARDFRIARHYADLDLLLSREKPDFVHLAVEADGGPTLARKFLSAGAHVLAAAPPAATLAAARELVDLAAGRSLRLMFGYAERFRPVFRALKRAVDSGAIGAVHYARLADRRPLGRVRPADPARPALDTLPHLLVLEGLLGYVDLARFLFGELTSVWGAALKLNPAVRGEDFALAALRTAGTPAANVILDINWSSPLPGRSARPAALPEVRLEGAGGAMEIDPAGWLLRVRGHHGAPKETALPAAADPRVEPHAELQGHFAECLESGRVPECSGEDALASLEAALAIYESERSGGLVLVRKP